MQELDFNVTVIGAGVVGLAVADALSGDTRQALLLEKNDRYGMETSSRNSEVIDAAIHYPGLPLKATLCREGNRLGIHATLDLGGRVRFGPDIEYVKEIDYRVDESKAALFFASARRYLPKLSLDALHPDTSGIRPKLQGPGEPPRDFIIREESSSGLRGLVNLIGIESPGLTSALSIAGYVRDLVSLSLRP